MALKKSALSVLLAGVVAIGFSGQVLADDDDDDWDDDDDYEYVRPVNDDRREVPEINALSTIPAVALLLGIIALRRERNRKK